MKKKPVPFYPEKIEEIQLPMENIYDQVISDEFPKLELKREKIKQDYGIQLTEYPLRIIVKGKELKGLQGKSAKLTIIDDRILIVCDSTPYRDIHAYDLNGNHLWDIEGCLDAYDDPNYSFGDISGAFKAIDGKTRLYTCSFPILFVTDLETGKGTRIWAIEDDTDMK